MSRDGCLVVSGRTHEYTCTFRLLSILGCSFSGSASALLVSVVVVVDVGKL